MPKLLGAIISQRRIDGAVNSPLWRPRADARTPMLSGAFLGLIVLLAACAPTKRSDIATAQHSADGTLGYGVGAVDGDDLAAMLETCVQVEQTAFAPSSAAGRGLPVQCDQLRRSIGNQPGNSVRRAR